MQRFFCRWRQKHVWPPTLLDMCGYICVEPGCVWHWAPSLPCSKDQTELDPADMEDVEDVEEEETGEDVNTKGKWSVQFVQFLRHLLSLVMTHVAGPMSLTTSNKSTVYFLRFNSCSWLMNLPVCQRSSIGLGSGESFCDTNVVNHSLTVAHSRGM